MKNMKKIFIGFLLASVLCLAACGTEDGMEKDKTSVEDSKDKNGEDKGQEGMEDDGLVGDTGEALKDGAEDLGEDIKDGARDAKDALEENGDNAREEGTSR